LTIFALSSGQCLLLVPSAELEYNYRVLIFAFPLVVVIAELAGSALSHAPGSALLLGAAALATSVSLGLPTASDLVSIVRPAIVTSPEKALGYAIRSAGLDRSMRYCTGSDRGESGARAFYLNRLAVANVFTSDGIGGRLCALLVDQESSSDSQRIRRVRMRSRLFHRVIFRGRDKSRLDVYLNDELWARSNWPAEIDERELSIRFSQEYTNFDRLFPGAQWAR
jgi:hypothetical protein